MRLCTRFRRLTARGKHPNVAVTAMARELIAFMWALAKAVPLTVEGHRSPSRDSVGVRLRFPRNPRRRDEAASADPRASSEAGATNPRQVVPHPRISAGSTVGLTGPASALTRVSATTGKSADMYGLLSHGLLDF